MIRQCCVCKRIFVGGKWLKVNPKFLEKEEITHGYCEICGDIINRDLDEWSRNKSDGITLNLSKV